MTIERNDEWAAQHFADRETVVGPIHPGEILLKEFLEPMGISQNRIALGLGIAPSRVNGIIKGKRGITADIALRLGRYFGMTPEFWMNAQVHYDLESQRDAFGDRLDREVRPLAQAV